jgi:hypothetical protein
MTRVVVLAIIFSAGGCGGAPPAHTYSATPISKAPSPVRDEVAGPPRPWSETRGGARSPAAGSAPQDFPPPPETRIRFGARELVLAHHDRAPIGRSIRAIHLDAAQLYPPAGCTGGEPAADAGGLCSPKHVRLRSDDGKGKDLELVAHRATHDGLFLVFSAGFLGSPECGLYGVFTMWIDTRGNVRVGEPAIGCFGGFDHIRIELERFRVFVRPYAWSLPESSRPGWVWVPTPR